MLHGDIRPENILFFKNQEESILFKNYDFDDLDSYKKN